MNSKTRYPAEGPVEAARAMKQEPGFVFLDSALPGDGSLSVLACKPDLVLRGRDWEMLEQEFGKIKKKWLQEQLNFQSYKEDVLIYYRNN